MKNYKQNNKTKKKTVQRRLLFLTYRDVTIGEKRYTNIC